MNRYGTVLTYLADIETAPSTLALALLVARQHDAHLEALHVEPDPVSAVPLIDQGMSASMIEDIIALTQSSAKERTECVHKMFEAAIDGIPMLERPPAQPGLSAWWRNETGYEDDILPSRARLSDLVVMAHPSSGENEASILSLNAVLMESGRPLLLAPAAAPKSLGQNIAVFWNDSVEAARAVASAMPFLERASKVLILSAREANSAVPEALATGLAWRGIAAGTQCLGECGQVGPTLLATAERSGADMVVMGAYTHSRLSQLILGGVTRNIMQSASLPILMCH